MRIQRLRLHYDVVERKVDADFPAAATLVSPTGTIATTTPTYTWNAVSNATHYLLFVGDSGNPARINTWYTAGQAGCAAGTGTCSVTPATALATGPATWWIETWNPAGAGPWSAGRSVTVEPVGPRGEPDTRVSSEVMHKCSESHERRGHLGARGAYGRLALTLP